MLKAIIAVIAALLLGALGAALFVESGFYNIGADDHHTKAVLALITQLRNRSIEARLGSIKPQLQATPAMIKAGAEHYAALCVGCHLAPGQLQVGSADRALSAPAESRARGDARIPARLLDRETRHQNVRDARLGQDPG